jgi:MFS family permease
VLAATYFYIYTLMQIPTGVLVDTLGPRRIVVMGGLIGSIGSVLFGIAESFELAATGRTLVGLGVSVMFIALLKLNAAWFHERHFATATGLTVLLGNVGSVLAAAPLAWLVTYTSWRNVFVGVGLFSLLLAAFSWRLVRNHPSEAGLPSMRELDGKTAHAPHDGHWFDGLQVVVRNPASWPGLWVNVGLAGSFFTFAGLWAIPFLTQAHGLTREIAAWHTSLMLLAFALSAFFGGMVSDHIQRRKPVLVGLALVYVASWLVLLTTPQLPLSASLALFALMGASAASFTLSWACAKEVNPPALSGMATSLVNTGTFFSVGILQPLVGWLLDHAAAQRGGTGDYIAADFRLALIALLVFAVIGLVATLQVKETNCHNIYGKTK